MKTKLLLIGAIILISSCVQKTSKITVNMLNNNKQKAISINLTSVKVQNDQLILTGSHLDIADTLTLAGTQLSIISKTASTLTAQNIRAFALTAGQTFDLIIGTANGAQTFPISFDITDGSITASKLNNMGATAGQILKFDGTNWIPSSPVSSVLYLGTWDPVTNTPAIINSPSVNSGEFYIVSHLGVINGVTYNVGDWLMSDGSAWNKINATNFSVASFNGRMGAVVPLANDYTWAMIDKTQSKLEQIADIDVTGRVDGNVLVWNAARGKWIPGNPSLTETDPTVMSFAKSSLPTCGVGKVLTANGTSFSCVTDNSGAGAFTGTANRAVVTNGSGALTTSNTTATELSYLSGTTSSIQAQINALTSGLGTNVLGTTLSTLSSPAASTILASDTVIQAFSKLQAEQNSIQTTQNNGNFNYVSRNGDVLNSGTFDFSAAVLRASNPIGLTDVVNLNYLQNNYGQWNVSGSNIYRAAGNVSIGSTTSVASAILNMDSSTRGFLPPRLTTAQRDAISNPATGLQIYNSTTNLVNFYNGTSWQAFGTAGAGLTSLNTLTGSSQNFATGTTGTDFNISSSGTTHTFNIPDASASTRGLINASLYNTFNSKLSPSLTSGYTYVGNASGVATAVPLSGDLTLSNTGIATISNNAVSNVKVSDVAFSKITGLPTTLAGYGITDGISSAVTSITAGAGLTGGTITTTGTIGLGVELAAINGLATTGYLKRTGTGAYTTASSFSLTTDVTGILPIANGGTGATTLDGAGIVDKTTAQTISGVKSFSTTMQLNNQSDLRLMNSGSTNYVALKAPASIATNFTLTLPTTAGSNGQMLTTDGSGNLSWSTPAAVGVTSVNGNTGAVTLTTTDITEGTNLYFTTARVLSTPLTGFSSATSTALSQTDTVLSGMGKLQGQINNFSSVYIPKTGATLSSGTFLFNGTALLQTSVTPVNANDVVNKAYVDSFGQWVKTGTDIYYTAGNVGINTSTPGANLDIKGTMRLSGSTSGYVGFTAPAAAGSTSYTLPSADGTSGYALSTNGAGVLSWIAPPTTQWTQSGNNISYTAGNVGIGTTAPTTALSVSSASGPAITANAPTGQYAIVAADATNTIKVGLGTNASLGGMIGTVSNHNLNLGSNSTTTMSITSAGNVGIGTTTPTNILEVVGGTAASGAGKGIALTAQSAASGSFDGGSILLNGGAKSGTGNSGQVYVGYPAGTTASSLYPLATISDGSLIIKGELYTDSGVILGNSQKFMWGDASSYIYGTNNGSYVGSLTFSTSNLDRVTIASNGKVGIGTATPSYPLSVVGDISTTSCIRAGASTVGGTCTSDKRLKKNIREYSVGLEALKKLNPKEYEYNGLGEMPLTHEKTIGFIAQEVEKASPDLVGKKKVKMHESDNFLTEIMTVNYSRMIYVVINAIKEFYHEYIDNDKDVSRNIASLKAETDLIAKENDQIKAENDAIEKRIQKLEQKLQK